MFVHVYASAHAYVHACVEARSSCQVSSLLVLYLSFQREPLFELEAHWFQLGWLVSKPQSSSCLCFPRIDIWTQVLLLFYGNHLTNYTISPAPDNALKITFIYSIILCVGMCIYMCLDTEMPHCACGGQSTTHRSLFSFYYMGPRDWVSDMAVSTFTYWAIWIVPCHELSYFVISITLVLFKGYVQISTWSRSQKLKTLH